MVKTERSLPTIESVMRLTSTPLSKVIGGLTIAVYDVMVGDKLVSSELGVCYEVQAAWCYAVISNETFSAIVADCALDKDDIWKWLRECESHQVVFPFMSDRMRAAMADWVLDARQLCERQLIITSPQLGQTGDEKLVICIDYDGDDKRKAEMIDKQFLPYIYRLIVKDGSIGIASLG